MRQVLIRAFALLNRPAVALAAALIAGGGAALVALPLFNVPGYELSQALALGFGTLGGIIGGAAGFQERRLIQGVDPRPRGALRVDSAFTSAALAVSAAFVLCVVLALVPLFAAIIHALVKSPCDPWKSIGFFPILVIPSALMASAAGVFGALLGRRWWLATIIYLALVIVSAVVTVWPIYFGPQAFAYNHFGGYFPGPLYDEALGIRGALAWYRLQTLLVALFIWLSASLMLNMRDGALTRPHLRPGSAVLLAAVAFGIFTLEERGCALGFRSSDAYVAEKLGGKRETEHFVIHHPRGKPKQDLERLVRDLEYRYAQLIGFLGEGPKEKLTVWVYRSADDKHQLVGAAHTQFAKPWRYELHINDGAFPHSVVKHELVHALSGAFGTGPFKVTSRFGVWTHIGIVEGLAVAADNPMNELTLHEWAAGMRRQQLMPDIRKLLSPAGFYTAAASRAYTAAGSFLKYLGETHGSQKLRQLYAHGDFDGVYGRSLDALATEWEQHLDGLPLDEAAVNLAFGRFRQGSLFARPCAREVAALVDEARETLRSDPERSLQLYQRCAKVQPDEPSHLQGAAQALLLMDKKGDAVQVLSSLAEKVKDQPALLADAELSLADVAWKREAPAEAIAHLDKVLQQKPAPTLDRTANLKKAAISSPNANALWAWFEPGPDDVKLLMLQQALQREPKDPYANYLVGRRLTQIGAARLAQPYLAATLSDERVAESIRRETLRLQLQAAYMAGDCNGVRDLVGKLPDFGAAFKGAASDWVDRCAFEERAFNGALVPDGPFG